MEWVRCTFDWYTVNPAPDRWEFDKIDKLVAKAKEAGLRLPPILILEKPFFTDGLAPNHRSDRDEYVTRVVTRHHKDIRHWEIWNRRRPLTRSPAANRLFNYPPSATPIDGPSLREAGAKSRSDPGLAIIPCFFGELDGFVVLSSLPPG